MRRPRERTASVDPAISQRRGSVALRGGGTDQAIGPSPAQGGDRVLATAPARAGDRRVAAGPRRVQGRLANIHFGGRGRGHLVVGPKSPVQAGQVAEQIKSSCFPGTRRSCVDHEGKPPSPEATWQTSDEEPLASSDSIGDLRRAPRAPRRWRGAVGLGRIVDRGKADPQVRLTRMRRTGSG